MLAAVEVGVWAVRPSQRVDHSFSWHGPHVSLLSHAGLGLKLSLLNVIRIGRSHVLQLSYLNKRVSSSGSKPFFSFVELWPDGGEQYD